MPKTARQNEQNVLETLLNPMLAPNEPTIDFHPSFESDSRCELAASIKANRVDPKFLYATPRQAALWRKVFLRHSPIHTNPEFTRIYREAFERIASLPRQGAVHLIGLGSGTGAKERDLCLRLKSTGAVACFSAIDVSRELIIESMRNLAAAGATTGRSLVCDLGATDSLHSWLERHGSATPRILTLFGLIPNLAPITVVRLMRAVLRPGDLLLVSAHLAPISDHLDLATAMRRVLPQYDNAETMAWLTGSLVAWKLAHLVEAPRMTIGEIEGVPAFIAEARWKTDLARPLRVFHSLRYTSAHFETLLKKHRFSFDRLAITACGEEAIWSVQLGA
jgi:hypothetical protein